MLLVQLDLVVVGIISDEEFHAEWDIVVNVSRIDTHECMHWISVVKRLGNK